MGTSDLPHAWLTRGTSVVLEAMSVLLMLAAVVTLMAAMSS
jgi:hypothetical protein